MSLADGMLPLLKAEPRLLLPAPDTDLAQAIEHRRKNEIHICLRCPERARVAYIAQTDIGNRWVDLCPACDYWLTTNASSAVEADNGQ